MISQATGNVSQKPRATLVQLRAILAGRRSKTVKQQVKTVEAQSPALHGFLSMHGADALLAVKLQPRASTNEICEPLGNELRIKVTAPPVDAAANEALLRLLADKLDCPRNRVELIRGHTSRHKVIKLHGISAKAALSKLL